MKNGMSGVVCGETATKGVMEHPYCDEHYKSLFNDDDEKYSIFIDQTYFMYWYNK